MSKPCNVYIGRQGVVFIKSKDKKVRYPSKPSKWCNPYKIGKDGTREEVLNKYRSYITSKIERNELDIEELRGKALGCWCKPEPCHGDVLVELLNE